MAVFGPRFARLQATTALAFVPISHPANRFSHFLAADGGPLDPASPDDPRELRLIAEENDRLRAQLARYQGALDELKAIHQDRQSLGEDVLPRCTALRVVGGDGDVLNVLAAGSTPIERGMPVLHYERGLAGIAGIIASAQSPGAQVRLISDPAVRIEGAFQRYNPATNEWITLPADPPLIEGAGNGLCQVARARKENLDQAGVAVGDWAVLNDASSWPLELLHYRIGRVVAIEEIPDEPGFARIRIEPSADLRRIRELMVMAR
jgi:hypothetical protein